MREAKREREREGEREHDKGERIEEGGKEKAQQNFSWFS